ncbi:MAG: hypothetical protein H6744_09230 [Deltaproteobacteria bacterium]|nr:hypothetical protein [Deltaproteobacteria bacterium]
MRAASRVLCAVSVSGLIACGGDGTNPPNTPAPAANVSAVKSDCPDCDPAGANAFVQAGLGSGFYALGDHWQVAFRYTQTPMAEKRDEVFLGSDVATSEVFLFDYVVTATDRDVFDNVLRQTATVSISQAVPGGPDAGLFSPERIDRHEQRLDFTLNDLLEPVSEVLYSRRAPHGKRVRLDGKSSLQTGASLFPHTIPRVLAAGAVDAVAPELPADLADVVDAMDSGWRDAAYRRYTFDNGDVVYWAVQRGQLWPFYAHTRQGHAALVAWN